MIFVVDTGYGSFSESTEFATLFQQRYPHDLWSGCDFSRYFQNPSVIMSCVFRRYFSTSSIMMSRLLTSISRRIRYKIEFQGYFYSEYNWNEIFSSKAKHKFHGMSSWTPLWLCGSKVLLLWCLIWSEYTFRILVLLISWELTWNQKLNVNEHC